MEKNSREKNSKLKPKTQYFGIFSESENYTNYVFSLKLAYANLTHNVKRKETFMSNSKTFKAS